MEFTIKAGPSVLAFLDEIATTMVLLFPITRAEAVGRINRHWHGYTFREWGQPHMIFHETADYWARTVYYGKDSAWWQGEEGLEPLPYP